MSEKTHFTLTDISTPFLYHGELGTTNLNSLTSERYGVYRQSNSGPVYSGLNYPVDSPGSLMVLPARDMGCTQEFRPYSSNMLYRRHYNLQGFIWVWSDWCQEYNTDNKPSSDAAGEPGQDSFPTGGLVLWPSATIPPGWLVCDGSSFSPRSYPLLAGIFPDGTLPDLSGVVDPASAELRYLVRAV